MKAHLSISLFLAALALVSAGCPGSLEDPDRFAKDAGTGGATGGSSASGGTTSGGGTTSSGGSGAADASGDSSGGVAGSDAGAD